MLVPRLVYSVTTQVNSPYLNGASNLFILALFNVNFMQGHHVMFDLPRDRDRPIQIHRVAFTLVNRLIFKTLFDDGSCKVAILLICIQLY